MTKPQYIKIICLTPPQRIHTVQCSNMELVKIFGFFFLYSGKTFCLEFKSTKSQILLM